MEIIITKGQIEDIEVIAQFQVDIAMESEGTVFPTNVPSHSKPTNQD